MPRPPSPNRVRVQMIDIEGSLASFIDTKLKINEAIKVVLNTEEAGRV